MSNNQFKFPLTAFRMKKILMLSLMLGFFSLSFAQTTELSVTFKFLNIVEGYDHNTKTEVLIDGESVGYSAEVLQSRGCTFKVNVPKGTHDIHVVNYAKYEGTWEKHLIANEYSIDCVYDGSHKFKKKKEKLFLIFDIDTGTISSWKKAPKLKKPSKKEEG